MRKRRLRPSRQLARGQVQLRRRSQASPVEPGASGSPSPHSQHRGEEKTHSHPQAKQERPLTWSKLKHAEAACSRGLLSLTGAWSPLAPVLVLSATQPRKPESALVRPGSEDLEPQHKMKCLPVTWHGQVSCLREILASTNVETQEMSHASVRMPESALPSERKKLRQKAVVTGQPHPTLVQTGDGPKQVGFLLDSDTPLLSLLLSEDPGESGAFLQDTGAHPVPAGSVFIPLAFKPRNFYQSRHMQKGATSVTTGSSLIKPARSEPAPN